MTDEERLARAGIEKTLAACTTRDLSNSSEGSSLLRRVHVKLESLGGYR
jgi:hypothetical protein